jgi:O-antigen/teichoic acid export membrane protein
MVTQFVSLFSIWTILICGGKLYASALTSTITFLVSSLLLLKYKDHLLILRSIYQTEVSEVVSYSKEIFPYQWRIALSWMSGYFIFQLFNPVLFAYCGAEAAGHMGMTLAVLNGILNLTLSWTVTNVPTWSSFIAVKRYDELDSSFSKVLKSSSLVCLLGIVTFLVLLYFIGQMGLSIYERFLPFYLVAILSSTIFINNIINAWATYLRCHKKEPFLLQAVVVGLCSALSTLLTAKFIGVEGVVIGYSLTVLCISLPLSYYIYKTKKKEYNV